MASNEPSRRQCYFSAHLLARTASTRSAAALTVELSTAIRHRVFGVGDGVEVGFRRVRCLGRNLSVEVRGFLQRGRRVPLTFPSSA